MSIVIPPKPEGSPKPIVSTRSRSFNGTSLGSKPKNEEMVSKQVSDDYPQYRGNEFQEPISMEIQNHTEGVIEEPFSVVPERVGETTNQSNATSGFNFNVSGQNAQIHVSQGTKQSETNENRFSDFSYKSTEKSMLSFKTILGLNDTDRVDNVIEKLEYALKIAEAKKLILEAEKAVNRGELV